MRMAFCTFMGFIGVGALVMFCAPVRDHTEKVLFASVEAADCPDGTTEGHRPLTRAAEATRSAVGGLVGGNSNKESGTRSAAASADGPTG